MRLSSFFPTALAVASVSGATAVAGPPAAPAGVRVTVVGPGGIEVPGAEVFLDDGSGWKSAGSTGLDGTLVVLGVASDGLRKAAARFEGEAYEPKKERLAGVPLSAATVVLHVPHALRLAPEFVDGQTGAPVSGVRWRPERVVTGEARADGSRLLPFGFGVAYTGMTLVTPDGWVAFESTGESKRPDESTGWMHWIAPEIGRARAVYPLRRQAKVSVTLATREGVALAPTTLSWRFAPHGTWVDGLARQRAKRAEVAPGPVAIIGMPWYPGAAFDVEISGEDPKDRRPIKWGTRAALGATADAPLVVAVVEEEGPELDSTVDDAPSENPASDGWTGVGGGSGRSEAGGSVAVHIVRAKGRPVLPMTLHLRFMKTVTPGTGGISPPVGLFDAVIGADGTGAIGGIVPGAYRIAAAHGGLIPFEATVTVKAGEKSSVTLTEPLGGSIEVTVVDPAGRPLPFARVAITGPLRGAPVDVDGGVQRIDPFVGVDGRRTIRGVQPGEATVHAAWGPWAGESKVLVEEGRPASVKVTLVDPVQEK